MDNEKSQRTRRPDERAGEVFEERDPETPETSEHPAPGVEHEQEPDAENIMQAKDGPGTL
jgi:hypothetical protein